jgi:hypothetical protein
MAIVDYGKVKGSTWYAGDGITGTSTTPTVYSGSGVTYALAEDLYLNTTGADRANVYQCTLEGNADTALWVYVTSIKGDAVEVVNNLNSDSTTKALSAKMGKELYNLMKTAGIYPLCVTPTISDASYTASLVVKDVSSTFTVTDMDGNQGTYSYTSQGGDTATVIITIGTSIGLPNNGAVIKTIESSDAEIFSYELYDNASTLIFSEEPNLWKHITDDELNILPYTSITEGGNTYKSGLISKIISAVRTTLYPVTHAKAVWFNQAASKTMNDFVEDNIDPIEETSTASQSYTVGEHLIYGGIRYIVSSAITAGDTLTPGTNIEVKSIGNEIEQINTDLSIKYNPTDDCLYILANGTWVKWRKAYMQRTYIYSPNGFAEGYALGNYQEFAYGWPKDYKGITQTIDVNDEAIIGNLPHLQGGSALGCYRLINPTINVTTYSSLKMSIVYDGATIELSADVSNLTGDYYVSFGHHNNSSDGSGSFEVYVKTSVGTYAPDNSVASDSYSVGNPATNKGFSITEIWLE